MADSVLNLLFTVKKKGDGDKETAKGMNSLGKSVKQVRKEFKDMKAVMGAFNAGMMIVNAGIKAISDSAEHLGRTELKTAFEGAADSGKDLIDMLTQVKLNLPILDALGIKGRDSIAWLTDAATGFTNVVNAVQNADIFMAGLTGKELTAEQQTRALTLVNHDLTAAEQARIDAQNRLAASVEDSKKADESWANMIAAGQVATEKLIGPVSDLEFAMGELTTATLFHQASQGLDADASLALAKGMGLINDEALAAKQKLDDLRVKFDADANGKISAAEATNGYTEAVIRMNMELDGSLAKLQAIQAELNSMPGEGGGRVGGEYGDPADIEHATGTGGRWMTVPPGHPNDSYRVGLSSGEQYSVQPAVTNNYNIHGMSVTANDANEFSRSIGAAADRRSRT